MLKNSLLSLLVFLTSQLIVATTIASETNAETTNSSNTSMAQLKTEPRQKFTVMLEGSSLLSKGLGLKATYSLINKLSLGIKASKYKMTSDNNSSFSDIKTTEYQHDMTVIGTVLDFFPLGMTDERGLYVSAGATSANLKTSVKDSYFGNNEATDSKIGAEFKVGYQFVIHLGDAATNSTNIMFQVGGGYGNGGSVKWRYFSGAETKIEDNLLLDLNMGAQF